MYFKVINDIYFVIFNMYLSSVRIEIRFTGWSQIDPGFTPWLNEGFKSSQVPAVENGKQLNIA